MRLDFLFIYFNKQKIQLFFYFNKQKIQRNSMDKHVHALMRFLRYIKDTCHHQIQLYPSSTISFIVYIDAY